MTVPEAARRVGRNPETIRRWIWSGKLASRKVGNQHLVTEDDLLRVATPGSWHEALAMLEAIHATIDDATRERARRDVPEIIDLVRGEE